MFVAEKARDTVPRAPIAELLRLQRREIVLAGGSILGGMGFAYMAQHLPDQIRARRTGLFSRSFIWEVGALGGLVSIAFVALSATLCDRVGRRRMMLLGWAACVPWALRGDAADRHRQTACSTRWRSSACAQWAGSVPGPPEHSSLNCSPPATATAARLSRSTSPACSAAHCRRWSPEPCRRPTAAGPSGRCSRSLRSASFVCTYLLPETKGIALGAAGPPKGPRRLIGAPSVGVQLLVEGNALTVAGHHLDRSGHRIAAEQQVIAAGQVARLDRFAVGQW